MIPCSTRSRVMRYYQMQLYCMSCDYTSLVQDHMLVIICILHLPFVQWQMLLNNDSDVSHLLGQDVFVYTTAFKASGPRFVHT